MHSERIASKILSRSIRCGTAACHRHPGVAFGVQRGLIAEFVDSAKLNWAHIAISQLMANGWIDRILTTNFDSLVVRASSLIGLHPAVYDFAASQLLKPAQVPNRAVFHLHGQRTGFVLMNTEKECQEHSDRLGPLFKDAGLGRTWIGPIWMRIPTWIQYGILSGLRSFL